MCVCVCVCVKRIILLILSTGCEKNFVYFKLNQRHYIKFEVYSKTMAYCEFVFTVVLFKQCLGGFISASNLKT